MGEPDSYFCESCRERVYAPFNHNCPPGSPHWLVGYPKPLSPNWGRAKRVSVTEGWEMPEPKQPERVVEMLAPYDGEEQTVIAAVPPPPKPPEVILLDNPKPKETVTVPFVRGCARCGGDHQDVVFTKLSIPVMNRGAVVANYWAPCPINGEPIMNRVSSG